MCVHVCVFTRVGVHVCACGCSCMHIDIIVFSVDLHFVYNEWIPCQTWSLPISASLASRLASGYFLCLPLLGLQAAAPPAHPFM